MKKSLLFFASVFMSLMCVAQSTAKFDFNTDYAVLFPDLPGLSADERLNEQNQGGDIKASMTSTEVNGFTVTVTPGKPGYLVPNHFCIAKPRLRMYGGTLTINIPEGKSINSLTVKHTRWNTLVNGQAVFAPQTVSTDLVTETVALDNVVGSIQFDVQGNTQIESIELNSNDIKVLAPIASLSELSSAKAYNIKSSNGEGYLYYSPAINGDYVGLRGVTNTSNGGVGHPSYTEALDPADPNGLWRFFEAGGQYYLYNVGAQKYVYRDGRDYKFTTEISPLDGIRDNADGTFGIHAGGGMGDGSYNFACIVTKDFPQALRNWTYDDHGSTMEIAEVENISAGQDQTEEIVASLSQEVTYIYTFNGETIGQETVSEIIGQAPEFVPAVPEYVTVEGMPEVTTKGTTEITLTTTLNEEAPFELGKEYAVFFHNGSNYYYWNDSNEGVGNEVRLGGNPSDISTRADLETFTNTAHWIMGGDWKQGFTFTNAETQNVLVAPAELTAGGVFEMGSEATRFDMVKMENGFYRFYVAGQKTFYIAHTSHGSHRISMWNAEGYGLTEVGGASCVQFEEYVAPEPTTFPAEGKQYTLTAVTQTGDRWAWTIQNNEIVPVKDGKPAIFTCEMHNGVPAFRAENGMYLRNHDNSNGTSWLEAGTTSATGLDAEYSEMANLYFEAFPAEAGNVDAGYENLTAGLYAIRAARGIQNGSIVMGYFIMKTDGSFTGAATSAPFFTSSYTSAFEVEEYVESGNTPEELYSELVAQIAKLNKIIEANKVEIAYGEDTFPEDIISPVVGKAGYKGHDIVFRVADDWDYFNWYILAYPNANDLVAEWAEYDYTIEDAIAEIQETLEAYNEAPVCLPEEGKTYILRNDPYTFGNEYSYAICNNAGTLATSKYAEELGTEYQWTCAQTTYTYINNDLDEVSETRYTFQNVADPTLYIGWKATSTTPVAWYVSAQGTPVYGTLSFQTFADNNHYRVLVIDMRDGSFNQANGHCWGNTYSDWYFFDEVDSNASIQGQNGTTGVGTVLAPEATNAIYNIQGQKMNSAARGLNIMNGRKMIRK